MNRPALLCLLLVLLFASGAGAMEAPVRSPHEQGCVAIFHCGTPQTEAAADSLYSELKELDSYDDLALALSRPRRSSDYEASGPIAAYQIGYMTGSGAGPAEATWSDEDPDDPQKCAGNIMLIEFWEPACESMPRVATPASGYNIVPLWDTSETTPEERQHVFQDVSGGGSEGAYFKGAGFYASYSIDPKNRERILVAGNSEEALEKVSQEFTKQFAKEKPKYEPELRYHVNDKWAMTMIVGFNDSEENAEAVGIFAEKFEKDGKGPIVLLGGDGLGDLAPSLLKVGNKGSGLLKDAKLYAFTSAKEAFERIGEVEEEPVEAEDTHTCGDQDAPLCSAGTCPADSACKAVDGECRCVDTAEDNLAYQMFARLNEDPVDWSIQRAHIYGCREGTQPDDFYYTTSSDYKLTLDGEDTFLVMKTKKGKLFIGNDGVMCAFSGEEKGDCAAVLAGEDMVHKNDPFDEVEDTSYCVRKATHPDDSPSYGLRKTDFGSIGDYGFYSKTKSDQGGKVRFLSGLYDCALLELAHEGSDTLSDAFKYDVRRDSIPECDDPDDNLKDHHGHIECPHGEDETKENCWGILSQRRGHCCACADLMEDDFTLLDERHFMRGAAAPLVLPMEGKCGPNFEYDCINSFSLDQDKHEHMEDYDNQCPSKSDICVKEKEGPTTCGPNDEGKCITLQEYDENPLKYERIEEGDSACWMLKGNEYLCVKEKEAPVPCGPEAEGTCKPETDIDTKTEEVVEDPDKVCAQLAASQESDDFLVCVKPKEAPTESYLAAGYPKAEPTIEGAKITAKLINPPSMVGIRVWRQETGYYSPEPHFSGIIRLSDGEGSTELTGLGDGSSKVEYGYTLYLNETTPVKDADGDETFYFETLTRAEAVGVGDNPPDVYVSSYSKGELLEETPVANQDSVTLDGDQFAVSAYEKEIGYHVDGQVYMDYSVSDDLPTQTGERIGILEGGTVFVYVPEYSDFVFTVVPGELEPEPEETPEEKEGREAAIEKISEAEQKRKAVLIRLATPMPGEKALLTGKVTASGYDISDESIDEEIKSNFSEGETKLRQATFAAAWVLSPETEPFDPDQPTNWTAVSALAQDAIEAFESARVKGEALMKAAGDEEEAALAVAEAIAELNDCIATAHGLLSEAAGMRDSLANPLASGDYEGLGKSEYDSAEAKLEEAEEAHADALSLIGEAEEAESTASTLNDPEWKSAREQELEGASALAIEATETFIESEELLKKQRQLEADESERREGQQETLKKYLREAEELKESCELLAEHKNRELPSDYNTGVNALARAKPYIDKYNRADGLHIWEIRPFWSKDDYYEEAKELLLQAIANLESANSRLEQAEEIPEPTALPDPGPGVTPTPEQEAKIESLKAAIKQIRDLIHERIAGEEEKYLGLEDPLGMSAEEYLQIDATSIRQPAGRNYIYGTVYYNDGIDIEGGGRPDIAIDEYKNSKKYFALARQEVEGAVGMEERAEAIANQEASESAKGSDGVGEQTETAVRKFSHYPIRLERTYPSLSSIAAYLDTPQTVKIRIDGQDWVHTPTDQHKFIPVFLLQPNEGARQDRELHRHWKYKEDEAAGRCVYKRALEMCFIQYGSEYSKTQDEESPDLEDLKSIGFPDRYLVELAKRSSLTVDLAEGETLAKFKDILNLEAQMGTEFSFTTDWIEYNFIPGTNTVVFHDSGIRHGDQTYSLQELKRKMGATLYGQTIGRFLP